MALLGKYNRLKVVKELEFGLYLESDNFGEILLPRRYVPEDVAVGDELEVFLYRDSEDRIIATTLKPYVTVGEVALLRVCSTNRIGAFMEWGLAKELLVPFREQKVPMQEGRSYVVYVYIDPETDRITASAKLHKYIGNISPDYQPNDLVSLVIENETELGYRVVVDNLHWGMIYHNEIFYPLRKGERLPGYVKQIRPDGKIDVSLQSLGYGKIAPLTQRIEEALESAGGRLPLSDKSSPEEIARHFECSKKDFKKAIGALFKERKIDIGPDAIESAPKESLSGKK